jgi:uncharacterized protein YjbI with pentapeptide repeats
MQPATLAVARTVRQSPMQSLIINEQNVQTVNWDEDCFKYCEFIGISLDGEHIDTDFNGCTFKDIDWYWGLFSSVNFIDCDFRNCVFRGTAFMGCKFVECQLVSCRFTKDNLKADCSFEETVSYNCKLYNCEGFMPELK